MQTRVLFTALSLSSIAMGAAAACTVTTAASPVPPPVNDIDSSMPAKDSGVTTGDASVLPPQGTQLVKTENAFLQGVTTDNYVVYIDTTANTVNAIAATGGTVESAGVVGSDPATYDVVVDHAAALVWSAIDANTGNGKLSIYTHAGGVKQLSTASVTGKYAISADGSRVIYFDNATSSTADLVGVSSDGTGKTTLVAGVDFANDNCAPYINFGAQIAVAGYCLANADADAGVGSATISSFSSPSWTLSPITSNVDPGFYIDSAGTKISTTSETAGLRVFPITGGGGTTIDINGFVGPFSTDGNSIFYVTHTGALMRSPVTSPAPTTLVAGTSVSDILGFSPDEKWLLDDHNIDPDTLYSDLFLTSATAMATETTLAADQTGNVYGDLFTADSSHSLFFTDLVDDTGTYSSAPTAGGAPTVLGSTVWIGFATTGSKVLFNDHYAPGGGGGTSGQADIESVDTAATAAPKVLVSQADANFYLTAAKDKFVYGWVGQTGDVNSGIWIAPSP